MKARNIVLLILIGLVVLAALLIIIFYPRHTMGSTKSDIKDDSTPYMRM
jgi:hypothetical protein